MWRRLPRVLRELVWGFLAKSLVAVHHRALLPVVQMYEIDNATLRFSRAPGGSAPSGLLRNVFLCRGLTLGLQYVSHEWVLTVLEPSRRPVFTFECGANLQMIVHKGFMYLSPQPETLLRCDVQSGQLTELRCCRDGAGQVDWPKRLVSTNDVIFGISDDLHCLHAYHVHADRWDFGAVQLPFTRHVLCDEFWQGWHEDLFVFVSSPCRTRLVAGFQLDGRARTWRRLALPSALCVTALLLHDDKLFMCGPNHTANVYDCLRGAWHLESSVPRDAFGATLLS